MHPPLLAHVMMVGGPQGAGKCAPIPNFPYD